MPMVLARNLYDSYDFSALETVIRGLLQGSVLDPLLFNLFINDLFLFLDGANLSYFADDNTIFASCVSLGMAKELVQEQCSIITYWFNPISTGLFCLVVALGGGGVFSTPLP